uniref:uncharacterized protein LOC122590287 n=1 Tax=Erigeron canadensis TaxID=72917 RepID=UPI001CB9CEDA|nr:uncharacterized protein LOC122590287 [Erigeron canadensis]
MVFFCGSCRSQKEDDLDVLWPCPTTSPRKPTRKKCIFGSRRRQRSTKTTTNPYSNRGLDKFEALLAELDLKRQNIFIQKGSEDVSMVKFIYESKNEVKPIIVRLRDQRKHDYSSSTDSVTDFEYHKDVGFVKEIEEALETKPSIDECIKKIRFDEWNRKIGEWWKPSYSLPLFVIIILVLLLFFGRSFAILCTSIGWYMVPIINKTQDNSKKPKRITKKEFLKKSKP